MAYLRRFSSEERGVAFVEFAMALPIFLVLFATTVDGARMLWSYQKAVAGVRDATRYLGRVAPIDACPGSDLSAHADTLLALVRDDVAGSDITPSGVTVIHVVPTLSCPAGAFRNGPVAVATVSATLRITLPFSGVFSLVGGDIGTFETTIADSTRIFGS